MIKISILIPTFMLIQGCTAIGTHADKHSSAGHTSPQKGAQNWFSQMHNFTRLYVWVTLLLMTKANINTDYVVSVQIDL